MSTPLPSPPLSMEASTTVRHEGRALVRGRIRRVWRDRYLELLDQGWLAYSEVIVPTTTDGHAARYVKVPRYTLAIQSARILDVTTLRDMHVGLPHGTYGFLFRGQRQTWQHYHTLSTTCQPPEEEPWRDYLCAVSNLDEAQMWVVALQWAASTGSQHRVMMDDSSHNDVSASWVMPTHPAKIPVQAAVDVPAVPTLADSTAAVPTAAAHSSSRPTPPPRRPAKTLVTKVTQVRTIRVGTWQWEDAYEIHALLLKSQQVETWTILRTPLNLEQLVRELRTELAEGSSSTDVPDLPKSSNMQASLSMVDSFLQSLVLDVTCINSKSLQTFLGLKATTTLLVSDLDRSYRRLWQLHDARAIQCRQIQTLHPHLAPEHYVREWLQTQARRRRPPSTVDVYANLVLRQPRPWIWLGGLSAALVLPRYLPLVTLRLDAWAASMLGAAYLGYSLRSPVLDRTERATRRRRQLGSAVPKTQRSLSQSVAAQHSSRKEDKDNTVRHAASNESGILVSANDGTAVDGSATVGVAPTHEVSDDDFQEAVQDAESSGSNIVGDEYDESDTEGHDDDGAGHDNAGLDDALLSSPLPAYPGNDGFSCWSQPAPEVFHVRGPTYFADRVKVPSAASPLICRGVDVWMTDNPPRHIARHPSVLGGQLGEADTFLVNFLLPFGNFVAYFTVPPLSKFPKKLRTVWTKFLKGDQQYRDARLKLLPIVMEGPWIVKAAVGPGKSPAVLGRVIPLQYFFREADRTTKAVYEVDVIITASSIAKGILSVVKGHTKAVTIGFAFIIEAAEQDELPEQILCSFQVHSLHLEDCPLLPHHDLDADVVG